VYLRTEKQPISSLYKLLPPELAQFNTKNGTVGHFEEVERSYQTTRCHNPKRLQNWWTWQRIVIKSQRELQQDNLTTSI